MPWNTVNIAKYYVPLQLVEIFVEINFIIEQCFIKFRWHDMFFNDHTCVWIKHILRISINYETQECEWIMVRIEEQVRVWTEHTEQVLLNKHEMLCPEIMAAAKQRKWLLTPLGSVNMYFKKYLKTIIPSARPHSLMSSIHSLLNLPLLFRPFTILNTTFFTNRLPSYRCARII